MRRIIAESQWRVEEDFLDLPIGYTMLGPVLPDISVVPFESFPFARINAGHNFMYIVDVYARSSPKLGLQDDTAVYRLPARTRVCQMPRGASKDRPGAGIPASPPNLQGAR